MTPNHRPTAWRRLFSPGRATRRLRGRISALLVGALLVATLSGCGCRPGYVGPYGGVHPGRCWIG